MLGRRGGTRVPAQAGDPGGAGQQPAIFGEESEHEPKQDGNEAAIDVVRVGGGEFAQEFALGAFVRRLKAAQQFIEGMEDLFGENFRDAGLVIAAALEQRGQAAERHPRPRLRAVHGLRQPEPRNDRRRERDDRRRPDRRRVADRRQQRADRGPEDEPESECRANQPKRARAIFRLGDIRDIRASC